jgi:glyoxylase-like metal-dependent hydrolase (beta-lactamase superfamily II)
MATETRSIEQPSGSCLAVGDLIVTAIVDAYTPLPLELMTRVPLQHLREVYAQSGKQTAPHCLIHAFLINAGGRLVLIDTGCGAVAAPEGGWLLGELGRLGIAPADIETILVTHLHADHIGGFFDRAGGAIFPNAELVVHEAELDFWLASPRPGAESAEAEEFAANRRLIRFKDRIRAVRNGAVLRGIEIVPEPGHTPGHSGYLIESCGERLFVWGDIVHQPRVQFACPDAGMVFDVDTEAAAATRKRVFEMAVREELRVAGMHFELPPFGRVERAEEGYSLQPL